MKNKLDLFFKRKLQNRQFEFDEQLWNQMEQLLPQKKKKRKVGLWIWLGIFLIGTSGAYWWMPTNTANNAQFQAQKQEKTIKKQNANLQIQTVTTEKALPNDLNRQPSQSTISDHNTISDKDLQATNQLIKNSKYTMKDKQMLAQKQDNLENSFSPQGKTTNNNTILAPIISSKQEISHENNVKQLKKDNKHQEIEPSKTIRYTIAVLELLPSKRTNVAYEVQLATKLSPAKQNRRWQYGIILEANQSIGKVGAMISYQIHPLWSMNTEIKYAFQKGDFSSQKIQTDSSFSFGYTALTTELQPKSKHYLEVPLYLSLDINHQSIIGGLEFQKLTGVKGLAQTYSSQQLSPSARLLTTTSEGWLPTKNYSSFKSYLMLGYEYRFRRITLGLRNHLPLKKLSILPNTSEHPSKVSQASWSITLAAPLSPKTKKQ